MVSWGQCDPVANVVGASRRTNREDVSSVHEPQLHARNGTSVAMCARNLLAEIAEPRVEIAEPRVGIAEPRRGDQSQPRPTAWVNRRPILILCPVRAKYELPAQSQT